MAYVIEKCIQKTSTKSGKIFKELELVDEEGRIAQVTAWLNEDSRAWFEALQEGASVNGKITTKGQYSNLYPPYDASKTRSTAPNSRASVKDDVSRSHMISDAMARKEQGIKTFQASKEKSMRYYAAIREAGNFMLYTDGAMDDDRASKSKDEIYEEFWRWQQKFYEDIKEDPRI